MRHARAPLLHGTVDDRDAQAPAPPLTLAAALGLLATAAAARDLRIGLAAEAASIDPHFHKRIDEKAAIRSIAKTFPRLAKRLDQVAVTLSGGEQQMLATPARRSPGRRRSCSAEDGAETVLGYAAKAGPPRSAGA